MFEENIDPGFRILFLRPLQLDHLIISKKLLHDDYIKINGIQLMNRDISGAIFTLSLSTTNTEFSMCRGRQICQGSLIGSHYKLSCKIGSDYKQGRNNH